MQREPRQRTGLNPSKGKRPGGRGGWTAGDWRSSRDAADASLWTVQTWTWGWSGCNIRHITDSQGWSAIWLARRVSPSSLTTPSASLPSPTEERTALRSKACQGHKSSYAPLLGPPDKLAKPPHISNSSLCHPQNQNPKTSTFWVT